MRKNAKLRCCASATCMWIFPRTPATDRSGCPKCGFAHYGARYVFGSMAYRYARTQRPWFDAQMEKHAEKLRREITATTSPAAPDS